MTSRADYLKKYLSAEDSNPQKKKKRKKDHKLKATNCRIVDDDAPLTSGYKSSSEDELIAATVAEVIDERTDEQREAELRRSKKWKGLEGDESGNQKTLSGYNAGLSTAQALKDELLRMREKEKTKFLALGDELTGKGAETVVRNRLKDKEREKDKKKPKEYGADIQEKYLQWGSGTTQSKNQQEAQENALKEVEKPFARYKDDVDLDADLKAELHAEDPMAAYLSEKRRKKKGGVQKPRYSGPEPPPNRFGIWPGYRWDGVDRSNGFEGKLHASNSSRKALKTDAYKWSTEDM